jgi:hypothetical protein
LLTEKTVKIIKKVVKDRNSQIEWNPELKKGVRENMKEEKEWWGHESRGISPIGGKSKRSLTFKSGPHSSREEAAKAVFKAKPKAKAVQTGYGKGGGHFDMQWHKKEEMKEEIINNIDLQEGSHKELGKLFPELKDNPTSHRERMVHSVTRYDRKQQEKASTDPKHYHNPHALGQYLGAVDRAHEDMTKGFSPADSINHHFNGTLANHLHKHCGTGGVDKDSMKKIHEKEVVGKEDFDENLVRYGLSKSLIEASKGILETKGE